MRIAMLSDLHIGGDARVDQFGHHDDDFLRFLDHLERTHDAVILNGDIWQTDHGHTLRDQRVQLEAARAAHPKIAGRFKSDPYVYIAGNHDIVATEHLGAPQSMEWEIDGLKILFTHGHLYDPVLLAHPGIDTLGSWLNGWVERVGFRRLAILLERFDRVKFSPRDAGIMVAGLKTLLESYDVVAMGHTHRAVIQHFPGRGWYVNSGSCSRGQFQWASMDTYHRTFVLHKGFSSA